VGFDVVGFDVGWAVGFNVGWAVGFNVGWAVGFDVVGFNVGWTVGFDVGWAVGFSVGSGVGTKVGARETGTRRTQRSQPAIPSVVDSVFRAPVLHFPFATSSS